MVVGGVGTGSNEGNRGSPITCPYRNLVSYGTHASLPIIFTSIVTKMADCVCVYVSAECLNIFPNFE